MIEIKRFFAKLTGKKYIRTGKCKACGRCCQKIYVRTSSNVIKEEEEFEKLKNQHFFYSYLKIVGKDDTGLIFECTKLDKEKGVCTAYNQRALLCRLYPQEEIFTMGGHISEDCGYKFTPVDKFSDVLKKAEKSYKK